MASIIKQTMPDGVTLELLDAITEAMNVDADPPKGMIVHTHYVEGGNVQVFDIWDSESDYRTFAEQRLRPAMEKAAESQGMSLPAPDAGPTGSLDAHRVVRGR